MYTKNYNDEQLEEVKKSLILNFKNVFDPEIPVNIYDLGLIYDVAFEEVNNYLHVNITMTLTSPGCPVADSLLNDVKEAALAVNYIDEAYVSLTFTPQWDMTKISEDGRELLMLSGASVY